MLEMESASIVRSVAQRMGCKFAACHSQSSRFCSLNQNKILNSCGTSLEHCTDKGVLNSCDV